MIETSYLSTMCRAAIAAAFLCGGSAHAASLTFQSGDGQSIASTDVDLQTSFAGIGYGQSFLNYQNNNVSVQVNDQNINTSSHIFFNNLNATQSDGFAYGNNGNHSFFSISAVGGYDLYGFEFQYGNGIGIDTMNLEWVALKNGAVVDTGIHGNAQRGTFYGLSGNTAFDEVRLSAYRTTDKINCDNDANCSSPIQFIALDNLRLDLDGPKVSAVPLPAGGTLMLTALVGLALLRRRLS